MSKKQTMLEAFEEADKALRELGNLLLVELKVPEMCEWLNKKLTRRGDSTTGLIHNDDWYSDEEWAASYSEAPYRDL